MAANLSVSQLSDSTSGWLRGDGTASGNPSSDPAPVGAILVYDVTLSNSDTAAASGVAVAFDLPANTRSYQLPAACTAQTDTRIVCRYPSFPGQASGGISFQLKVDTQNAQPGTTKVVAAIGVESALPAPTTRLDGLATSDAFFAGDSNPANNRLEQNTTLTAGADLGLTKSGSPASVIAGGEVTYTLTVRNAGPSTSTNFRVIDTLPAGFTVVANSFSGTGWTFNAGTTTATHAGALANGQTATFRFRAKANVASGTVTNAARVVAVGTPDPRPDNDAATANTVITTGADVTLSMVASPAPAATDAPVTFTLTADNLGPESSSGVSVAGVLPAGFSFTGTGTLPGGWTCTSPTPTTFSCTRSGSMAGGSKEILQILATAPPTPGNYQATAQIQSANTPDPNDATNGTNNNIANTALTVLADGADLRLSKRKLGSTDNAEVVPVGTTSASNMTSTLRLWNNGPARVTGNAQIVDVLAEGEEFIGSSGPFNCSVLPAAYTVGTPQVVTCDFTGPYPVAVAANNADASAFATLVMITRARAPGLLTNNACTGGSRPAGGPASAEPTTDSGVNLDKIPDNDCTGTGIRATADAANLSITKVASTQSGGDKGVGVTESWAEYLLTVRNSGADTAGVVVNDPLPGYLDNDRTKVDITAPAGWPAGSCRINAGSLICESGTTVLAANATAVIRLRLRNADNSPGFLFDSVGKTAASSANAACVAAGTVPGTGHFHCNRAGVGVDGRVAGSVGESNWSDNYATDWLRVDRVANMQTTEKVITSGDNSGRAGVVADYRIQYRNQGPSAIPRVAFTDTFTLPAGDSGFVLVSARLASNGQACTVTSFEAGITSSNTAGGISYRNTDAVSPRTLTLTCPAVALTNGQVDTVNLSIRPNVNASNTGRVFDNVAGFRFPDGATGSDANGDWNYNLVSTDADDTRSARLTFGEGKVDLLVQKNDQGFVGGVDPLGFDPQVPANNYLTYKVTVTNQGPSLSSDTRIRDSLVPPAGRTVTFIGASATATGSFSLAGCSVLEGSNPFTGNGSSALVLDCLMPGAGFAGSDEAGTVAAGADSALFLRYRYDSAPGGGGDTLSNTALVHSAETRQGADLTAGDANRADNSTTETTSVFMRSDMTVAKTMVTTAPAASPGVALPPSVAGVTVRQPFWYVITGINNGPGQSLSRDRSAASQLRGTGTVVVDTLPAGVQVSGTVTWQKQGPAYAASTPDGSGTCSVLDRVITCEVGDTTFATGNPGQVRILVPAVWPQLPAGSTAPRGSAGNHAQISTEQVDENPANDTVDVPLDVVNLSLAGKVFFDSDQSAGNGGTPQAGEAGIAGVTIRLSGTDAYGQPVNIVTTTDAGGQYRFDNLAPSDAAGYTVLEVQPNGYANSRIDPPTSGAQAATFNPESYQAGNPDSRYVVLLGADVAVPGGTLGSVGAVAVNYNFPEVRRPSLSGYVYVDLDFNNQRSPGTDSAIVGATVELLDADTGVVLATVQTDANGQYRFDDLDPNVVYSVREPLPTGPYTNRPTAVTAGTIGGVACTAGTCLAGTAVASPGGPDATSTDRLSRIDLGTGADGENFNFGENPNGSAISGRVWLDLDNDGVIDPTETGLAGVEVVLTGTDRNGQPVQLTTTTDADGNYAFVGLLPGTYVVTEPTQPTDTLNGITVPGDKGGTATLPAVVPSAITPIVLGNNEAATGYNFGEIPIASISGRVYYDNNDNGVIDADETGIADVQIVLTGTDDAGRPVSLTTRTDAQGNYSFPNLRPGTYVVTEPDQPAYTTNGVTSPGTVQGVALGAGTDRATVPSAISQIVLGAGMQSVQNNFGEVADTPDLVVTKRATTAVFTVNHPAEYQIQVRNIGPRETLAAYEVHDRLPAGLTLLETPAGNGWVCQGNPGEARVSCTSAAVIPAGATLADAITVKVMVGAQAAASGSVNNAVLVQGGGEDGPHAPSPTERAAFEGDVGTLPVCDPAITQNVCRVPNRVQLSASVGGTVWYDVGNDDQLLDGGDQRLPAWIVELVDPASGNVVASTVTGADGSYRFSDVVPGVKWNIRFRDPRSNIVWPFPVTRETVAGVQVSCDAAAAIANARASTCQVNENGSSVLEVVLEAGQHLPQQSLPVDPSGVVYDAVSRDPVPGSIVTLAPVGMCAGYDPRTAVLNAASGGYRIEGNAIAMTVGSEGFYQFAFGPAAPARCEFQLTVTPPGGYQFVSSLIPPQDGALSPVGGAGANHVVQANTAAPTGAVGPATQYYLGLFAGSATAAIVHNHLPLDTAVATGLVISKTGDRQTAEIGDTVQYTITVRQTAGSALRTVNVVDRLPRGFTYIDGTARANGRALAEPQGRPGPQLGFTLGALSVGNQIVLTYRVRIGVGAQQGDGINRAQAFGCGFDGGCINSEAMVPLPGALPSNRAEYRVRVSGGVFTDQTCVLGKVFVDCNHNHVQDREELGIPGVRLYFSDGTWVISDSEGKYSYCGLPPQSHTLKVDASTLPLGARLTTSSNRNLGDADSLFLDLKNGELHRADFVEGSCANPVLEQVKARRTQGEVRAPETEPGQAPLRFESKPVRAPQQATDTANQRPIVHPRANPPAAGTSTEGQP
ncbi:SdrD B-like domain-containing protein [Stenotrophomonas sp.]|uniref:SdrD B-like domain-containing protein n=1 Tax=Stenotrophomonas sp. TaxID=69392 RepID=UPI002FC5B9B8